MPEPISGRFLGLPVHELRRLGYDPARRIVPAWFCFRTFLETVPDTCSIQLSGRSQYKLYINGESILFGPCRGPEDVAYVDQLDIARWLKAGENRVLMQVFSYPSRPGEEEGPYHCFGDDEGPAVFMRGDLGSADPEQPENWRIWLDHGQGFNRHQVFMMGSNETVNGERSLGNPFFRPEWDASRTLGAAVVQSRDYEPFGTRQGKTLLPRPIPLLYRREKRFAGWEKRTIPPHDRVSFVLDAGELTTAYFRIGFRGGRGARVTLTYAESYFRKDDRGFPCKARRDDAGGFILGVRDEYLVGGDAVYEPFRFRTFRFIEAEVETGGEALTILPLPYVETAYPLANSRRPVFTDPKKEKLYDVAFRTLQLCAHDTYEDCPYYEQLMYACDTRLEILFTYAATEDLALPRQAIRLFSASMQSSGLTQSRYPSRDKQTIPAFALYYLLILEDYVDHTGDEEFIRPYIPIAERIVETFLAKRTPSGMLAPQGYWDYFDWTERWSQHGACTPTAARDGESALQNLFFVYALQSLCRLLPSYGRSELAGAWQREAEALLRLVEARCWDDRRGLYREGAFTEEYSQHTQVFAVLTGLAAGEKARSVMDKALTAPDMVPCSFMQRYYLFRALEKAGMYERTEALWQDWQDFIDLGCTTFPEAPSRPRSDCHGWSALPLTEFAARNR
ncbi:MAG: hypothetical protein IKP17_04695 [Oscillospiraceae bacterium]|nr:hypothetical protein [Oscillospiraceae bacterium]MBR4692033.1 hypothetical protein [Oscillospiraceae bacterium]